DEIGDGAAIDDAGAIAVGGHIARFARRGIVGDRITRGGIARACVAGARIANPAARLIDCTSRQNDGEKP
ncbi:MAG TPA: hypothetical protein VGF45_24850, partial [Polyangia bacterium]